MKEPKIIVGRAYQLRYSAGNPNNRRMHVRAIVDTYQVVVAVYSKRRGWTHRLEHLEFLQNRLADGELKMLPESQSIPLNPPEPA